MNEDEVTLSLLLKKVYRDSGYDFQDYKRGTIMHRLERRLQMTEARTYQGYIKFLDTHPDEYGRLIDYLTINVSSFFRSPATFQQIAKMVLPEVLSYKRDQRQWSLKFWSTACACGEEPYSIAILLADFLGNKLRDFDISIDATDISWRALGEAQAGRYTPKDVEHLPHAILESYFIANGDGYEVKNNIRQMVNFSHFDLTSAKPPPFRNVDCIFCCNVLIYLQKQLQEKVLGMLYDSLSTPGYLILGEVETPANSLNEKLECLDTKAKIYKKQD